MHLVIAQYALGALSGGLVGLSLGLFGGGGVAGGKLGAFAARQMARARGLLNTLFAGLIFVVAAYMLWRTAMSFMPA
jgi:uncharacterized membrane protein YfcA